MLNNLPLAASFVQGVTRGGVDLTAQYNTLRRRWKGILATLVAMLIGAIVLLALLTPRYTESTQILFDPRKQNVYQYQAAATLGLAIDTGSVESEVTLIQSFNVLRRVVEKLSLDTSPEFGAAASSGLLSLFSSRSGPREESAVDSRMTAPQLLAVRRLRDSVTARRVGLTYVVEIGATAQDPLLAARIADAVAQAYLIEQLEARFEVSKRASGWFTELLVSLREQLQESERKVADFRAQYGLVETQQGGAIDKQQVSELSAQLVLARAQTAERHAKFEQAERVTRGGGTGAAVTEVLQSQLISNLRTQEADVARREAELAAKYASNHPQLVNLRAEHADIRRGVADEIQRIISNFKNEYEVAQKREQSLEQSLARYTNVATQNDAEKVQLRDLEREFQSNRVLYESFLNHAKEARENTTIETSDSRVITPAIVPTTASFPRMGVFLGVASMLGLIAGVGLAFLLDYIENGFMTAEQIEALTDLPVLSVLPELGARDFTREGITSIPDYVARKPLTRLNTQGAIRQSVNSIKLHAS